MKITYHKLLKGYMATYKGSMLAVKQTRLETIKTALLRLALYK